MAKKLSANTGLSSELEEDSKIPMLDYYRQQAQRDSQSAIDTTILNDERTYRVSFPLPYGVLVALIDAEHVDADLDSAIKYNLFKWDNYDSKNKITDIGQLVLDGINQTAIRHKMLAGWRAQHNAEVDSDKTGFKKT